MKGRAGGPPPVRLSLMMFRLADGISYGTPNGVTIVLDLNRDRYFRLGGGAASALADLAGGRKPGVDALATLLGAGIILDRTGTARTAVAPVCLDRPALSALEVAATPSPALGLLRIARVNFRIRHLLARAGLSATVALLRRDRADVELHYDDSRAVGLAQRYWALRRLLPGKRACIAESFSLSVLLTRYGIAHDVAFGVSLAPFAAHAWAQIDSHVLSDRIDPVRAFHPVFRL